MRCHSVKHRRQPHSLYRVGIQYRCDRKRIRLARNKSRHVGCRRCIIIIVFVVPNGHGSHVFAHVFVWRQKFYHKRCWDQPQNPGEVVVPGGRGHTGCLGQLGRLYEIGHSWYFLRRRHHRLNWSFRVGDNALVRTHSFIRSAENEVTAVSVRRVEAVIGQPGEDRLF